MMFKLIVTLSSLVCVLAAPKHAYKSMITHQNEKHEAPIEVKEEALSVPTPNHQYLPVSEYKPVVHEDIEEIPQHHMPSWHSLMTSEHHDKTEEVVDSYNYQQVPMENQQIIQESHEEEAAVHHQVEEEEYYPHHHPMYEFKYAVEDHKTKDIHSQHEMRDGDVVKGEYMLHQPDGKIRLVKYYVDKDSGFKADVTYSKQLAEAQPEEQIPEEHY